LLPLMWTVFAPSGEFRPLMDAPDVVFQHCANVAAALYAAAPPYVTYHVSTHAVAPSLHRTKDVFRDVAVRTRDDVAIVQDLPRGANVVSHGFPLTPVFDALSYFTLTWKVGAHGEFSSYVHDVTPLTYDEHPNSTADVVVVRLRAYKVEFAADSSDAPDGKTHLALTPYDFTKNQGGEETFFLNDVVIDNATSLPVSVKYVGGDDKQFVIDYGPVAGHWVVTHAHYEETLHGPLHIGRLHVIADAVFDNFTFPADPPDPRLVPVVAATPTGT